MIYQRRLLLLWSLVFTGALGLQQRQHPQQPQQPSNSSPSTPLLNIAALKQAIYSGRVYQQQAFLSEDQVQTVLAQVQALEATGGFERKGLSNTVQKNQTFSDKNDRSVCVVPWFIKALEEKDDRDIPRLIRRLQTTLSEALHRPSMMDTDTLLSQHECYYSKSEVGSRLPRHLDERHDELKGAKGWLRPSRRSLSWLIYLSDPGWTLEKNGGALRSYPQQRNLAEDASTLFDSTHLGNLQVGWLLVLSLSLLGSDQKSQPVYLDSWLLVRGVVVSSDDTIVPDPHCVLYTLTEGGEKQYITRPWLNGAVHGMSAADFVHAWAKQDSTSTSTSTSTDRPCTLFLNSEYARQFTLLEDRSAWDAGQDPRGSTTVDIVPQRGSLVVFDSVTVPHQVELIKDGTRVALAGWFHEATQEFPEIFYSTA
jgi:hypothetical protein